MNLKNNFYYTAITTTSKWL